MCQVGSDDLTGLTFSVETFAGHSSDLTLYEGATQNLIVKYTGWGQRADVELSKQWVAALTAGDACCNGAATATSSNGAPRA